MSNISKKTYVWVLLAMAVIMGSGLLYSANARAGEIVKTEKNGDEGTFPWQNEFTTTALNYESDTQKETEKTTQKVTTQQKEETNVTTVVISDEKCVNATIKRAKIKKIKKKASNKISIKLKVLKGVNGYQIKISTSKKFKAKATRTLNINKINFTIKNIKNKKIYYVKVRGYRKENGVNLYGKWSKIEKQIKQNKKIKRFNELYNLRKVRFLSLTFERLNKISMNLFYLKMTNDKNVFISRIIFFKK